MANVQYNASNEMYFLYLPKSLIKYGKIKKGQSFEPVLTKSGNIILKRAKRVD